MSELGNTAVFSKILIANRGEIACRIMRTAHKMGIATVAVYSDADKSAEHVRMADEAVWLGGAASKDSYLRGDKIIQAALDCGAQAIHPGYGFLSENAEFVEAVTAAGLVFIGPDAHAIKVMGDKIESKALASDAGVSCVPGTEGAVDDIEMAKAEAERIGYPVMVKASAGGGGKGMRVIETAEGLEDGMRAAMTEARNAFGDDRVFIEKFVVSPRHIEIQVLGDRHGNVVFLGERECSVQRRHQKVIEEAPSSFLDEATRQAMGAQAVQLAKAVNYVSAGTVEFIVGADRDFYFLEMNTRLQVEHPVTEEVYGLDLAEWMIRVAAGEALSFEQKDVKARGWSVEARLYAEDSARGFLPSIGQLMRYQQPVADGVRADTGVAEGSMISMFYDPMIAKLICTAPDRQQAIDKLLDALEHYHIDGLATNRQFLSAIIDDADFRSGNITTAFIAEKFGDAFAPRHPQPEEARLMAAVAFGFYHASQQQASFDGSASSQMLAVYAEDGERRSMHINCMYEGANSFELEIDGHPLKIEGNFDTPLSTRGLIFDGEADGRAIALQLSASGHHLSVSHRDMYLDIDFYPAQADAVLGYLPPQADGSSDHLVAAPMPGLLTGILVAPEDMVEQGQNVAVIEAMKMENTLTAGMKGRVASVEAEVGDSLNVDDVIITLEPSDE